MPTRRQPRRTRARGKTRECPPVSRARGARSVEEKGGRSERGRRRDATFANICSRENSEFSFLTDTQPVACCVRQIRALPRCGLLLGVCDAKSGRRLRRGGVRAHLFGVLGFDDGLDDSLGGVLGGGSLDGLRVRWGGRGARREGTRVSDCPDIDRLREARERVMNWPEDAEGAKPRLCLLHAREGCDETRRLRASRDLQRRGPGGDARCARRARERARPVPSEDS